MKHLPVLATLLAAGVATMAQAGEGRLLRFPATNGHDVAFSYAGDLYRVPITGGTAVKLTSHNGYEAFARFSPDGRTLAFTAQYDGNTEVYTMPAEGGRPKRITFTGTNPRDDWGDRMGPNNIAMAWPPDGKSVVYRNRISDGFVGQLWAAPTDGSMPARLPLPEGGFCSYSPDGTKLAYNRVFREFRTWKYYKGGMADDVWVWDTKAGTVANITNNVGQDICPMWIGDEIYYISDRDKTMNIFVYNTATGQTSKVTNFTDYDVKFPSCGGGKVVFEKGGYLYSLDPATKQVAKIEVTLNSEDNFARSAQRRVSDFVTGTGIASDGSRVAISARGEVFDVPADEGVTRNITHTPGVHERYAQWSPDGSTIAWVSDSTGEDEIWAVASKSGSKPMQVTSGNDTRIREFTWSPDAKHIVYNDDNNRTVLVNMATKGKKTLVQDSIGPNGYVSWSPDSRWIAYHRRAKNGNNVVYLYNIATGQETAVTDQWYDSNSPAFSRDGKYLILASGRDFNPTYSNIEWNFSYSRMEGVYLVLLSKDTPSPFLPTDAKVGGDEQADKAAAAPAKKGKKASGANDAGIKVDLDGIADRLVKLPLSGNNYGAFFGIDNAVYYYGNGGTHRFDLEEQEDTRIAANAMMDVSADGKTAIFRTHGNDLYVMPLPKGKVNFDEALDLDDMIAPVDYAQEWRNIYDEAWRNYRDHFYLANMHGVDWQAVHDKYAALLPWVKNRLDLTYVIGGMIGELACGHCYVDGGDQPSVDKSNKIGLLGAVLERSGKAYRIAKIYRGAPDRSSLTAPLAVPGMNVNEGDYITAIDGVSTDVPNIYELLQRKAGVLTELTVASSADGAGARQVVVNPIQDEYPLTHYEWVMNNIKHVNERSGGKVGYIYIPDMGPDGLNEFSRAFFAQLDKEALIIDDRGNGGGNISPMIIERLLRKPYRMTMFRSSNLNGTIPEQTIYGPKVLLINKYSCSDGDLFPWSFKANEIGTVVGTRTWGGIVGINGSLDYIDGTYITTPMFTNYDVKTGQWIVENHGVDPDILVDNDPVREFNGEDQQLDKAIDVILEQLKQRKPLPSTPAPRTLPDLGVEQ